jgi:hypothetical protein
VVHDLEKLAMSIGQHDIIGGHTDHAAREVKDLLVRFHTGWFTPFATRSGSRV